MLVDEVDGGPVRGRQGHGGPDMAGTADQLVMAQPRRVLILRAQPQSLDQYQLHFSVAELEIRIDCCVSHRNDNPEPFVRTKLADEILDKVARGQATLDRITKSATHH
ncbi:MAG TPA: hypothetical protein VFX70_07465 [Mycobacteriales bacterium]|nr:hypothetical protein [Mycobacteriales bacterium]